MKKLSKTLAFSTLIALALSCSVKKDGFVNRNFHAVTTKYNVLFNGEQAYLKGIKDIEDNYRDNFWKRLPIEPIAFDEDKIIVPTFKPGTGFDDADAEDEEPKQLTSFDRAEEKAVKAIQKHSMNIRGFERNRQIDDAYLLLGKSRYYTQRFIPAIEAFNYIIANYPKADLIYDTKIWRAKANIRLDNETLAIETLDLLLKLDKNEENLSDLQRERAHTAMAMAYEKTDTINKVIEHLKLATRTFKNKEQAARNMFILGQIYSELNHRDSARMVFQKLADYRRAPYKYRIRANVELAKNTEHDSASVVVLARLKKLIKNSDNRKYLNALYFQAGVLEKGRGKFENAEAYFQKSLKAKTNTDYQKTHAYEQLGNLAFEKQQYVLAGSYYDSVLGLTSKKFDQEKRIRRLRRKNKGLTTLRKFEETVQENDSILTLVGMSSEERTEFFETYIAKIKKEDEERRQQMLNAQNFGTSFGGFGTIGASTRKGKWYFYNDQSVAFGKAEFEKVWGTRPLEDNWRVSDKSAKNVPDEEEVAEAEAKPNPRYMLATYLEAIPEDPKVVQQLKDDRNEALYQLGLIYKEQFKNPQLAIEKLERLLTLRKDRQTELAASYHLYQIYKGIDDVTKADQYKEVILTKYPDTRFAQVIRTPDQGPQEEKKVDEAYRRFKNIYVMYKLNKFEETIEEVDKFLPTLKNSNLIPKLALIKALAIGKHKDKETYKKALEFVSLSYANTDAGKKAKEIITQLNKVK